MSAAVNGALYNMETLRAAKAGDRDAQHSIAVAYAWGDEGVRRNLRQARHWYGLAAGRGNEEATFNYAAMLLSGEGGPREEAAGTKWMRKASSEGSTSADVYLGDRLAHPQCRSQAHARQAARHYARAALRGNTRGLRELLSSRAAGGSFPRQRARGCPPPAVGCAMRTDRHRGIRSPS